MAQGDIARPSLLGRALVGVLLLVGFYALAAAGIALCVILVWVQLQARFIVPKLILVTVVVGATVTWSVLKSLLAFREHFEPPGPEVTALDEPALFALIHAVADEMGTYPPRHVYLFPEVNAFVAEVGGFLGFGTRRVMGIGVGLLQVDTVQQLKATLAHEFGHFVGGDTRVGAFFYRTRSAIARAVQSLGGGVVASVFLAYLRLFLRVTSSISRAQELSADRESARVAGRTAHIEGLRREARGAVLYSVFLRQEVAPLLGAGFRPTNLYLGFRQATREMLRQGAGAELDEVLGRSETDLYDTHPALPDRIAFAETLPAGPDHTDDRLARCLLADPKRWEKNVTRDFVGRLSDNRFEPLLWRDAPQKVYAPRFLDEARDLRQKVAARYADATSSLTAAVVVLDELPTPLALVRQMAPEIDQVPLDERGAAATRFLCRALAVLLGDHLVASGGSWHTSPGRGLSVQLGKREVPVFTWSNEAASNPTARARLQRCLDALTRGETLPDDLTLASAEPEAEPEAD